MPNISVTHRAYIIGYEDGTFRPEGNITRAEAAAIFARNIAELKDESISGRTTSFDDVKQRHVVYELLSLILKSMI